MKTFDIVLLFLLVFLAGIIVGLEFIPRGNVQENVILSDINEKVSVYSPALSGEEGVIVEIVVYVKEGSGKILVDVDDVLSDLYIQESARLAAKAASHLANISLDNKDIIYSVKAKTGVIEGPSAGATMALGTYALLTGKQIKRDVMMTGAVLENGKITAVGGVVEKAQAAKDFNVTKFIVAKGLGYEVEKYNRVEACKGIVCRIVYRPVIKSFGDDIGIQVIEVDTLEEAAEVYLE